MTNDTVAQGCFNRDSCSAQPVMSAWQAQLLNTEAILLLLCDRLEADFIHTPVKGRKAFNHSQVEAQLIDAILPG